MTSFDDVMKVIKNIHDQILLKIRCDEDHSTDLLEFSKHLFETKCWFVRASWINKKKFLLELTTGINDISSVSALLKSIWNCKPKDAIISISESNLLSSYDQVPMDHNRTVILSPLQDIMMNDSNWFRSLESRRQCLVLAELLSIAGGPIMWEVLKFLEKIYDKHKELEIENLKECVVVVEPAPDKKAAVVEMNKKDHTPRRKSSATHDLSVAKIPFDNAQAQKELESNLTIWASAIKSLKDNSKLEELEMTFKDGIKKKIWRANRPKTDLETVDIIQLLPSAISKRILNCLPSQQLNDCARVNKYWAYLVDELRAELVARQKIDIELERLRENMLRHDVSLGLLKKPESFKNLHFNSPRSSVKIKEQSYPIDTNFCAYNLRLAMKRVHKPHVTNFPFRNITDLNERLSRRGAVDENLWNWCRNVSKNVNEDGTLEQNSEGLTVLKNFKFPRHNIPSVKIPLSALVSNPKQK